MMPLDQIAELRRDRPIRVGMVGAGFMARGIANQILNHATGLDLVAVSNRSARRVEDLFSYAGVARQDARNLIWDDPFDMLKRAHLDVVVDATGAVEFGAQIAVAALDVGIAQVSLNAELDGTVGGVLAARAKDAGAIYSAADGDQPGVQMNLIRWVRSLGLKVHVSGNIKGLQLNFEAAGLEAYKKGITKIEKEVAETIVNTIL